MDTKGKTRLLSLIKKCSLALYVVSLAAAYFVPDYMVYCIMVNGIVGITAFFSTALHAGYPRELRDCQSDRK